jgi:peptide/nickel transport system substrate-binding protein
VPVPDPNTRVEGAVSGQFEYVDALPVEAYDRLKKPQTSEPVLLKPFGWPVFVMNTKQGSWQPGRPHRGAPALSMEDMLAAAFGNRNSMPQRLHVSEGLRLAHGCRHGGPLQRRDPEKAKALLKKANYDGKPLRILTSRQYEFHYKMAQVASRVSQAGRLHGRHAGGGLGDPDPAPRRSGPVGHLHHPQPVPAGAGSHRPSLRELARLVVHACPQEGGRRLQHGSDPQKRVALWAEVQKAIYDETPSIKIGDFNALSAQSPKLEGVVPAPWPYFWNAR